MLLQTGSGAKNGSGAEGREDQDVADVNAKEQREVQRMGAMHISKGDSVAGHGAHSSRPYPYLFMHRLVIVNSFFL